MISVNAFRKLHRTLSSLHVSFGSEDTPHPSKVYVSRADVKRPNRNFANIDEFEEMLTKLGFYVIVPTDWTPRQIISIMATAHEVIGIHGAGLTNMLFCGPGTRVVELINFPGSWESLALIGSAVGFEYHRVRALAPTEGTEGRPLIDLNRVKSLLAW